MSRFTVKSHRPVQWSVTIIVLSTLVAVATWLALDDRHWSVIYDRMSINDEYSRLLDINDGLQQENQRLNETLLMMERAAVLDKQTASLMQKDVQSLQDEIFQLKGELEFYQGIMDATRESAGLSIQGVHIDSLPQENCYRLKLVLTHVAKNVKVATGTLEISVEGVSGGNSKHLDLQDISLEDPLDLSFSIRNFSRFETDLELPDGFTPRRVSVYIQPGGEKQSKIKRVFDWPEITS